MEKWGERVIGEKIIDTQMIQINYAVYKAAALIIFILTVCIFIFIYRIKKKSIVLAQWKRRRKKYIVSISILSVFALVYYVFMYTDMAFKLIFNLDNYFIFTFFPPSYRYINLLLVISCIFIIFRCGYCKVEKEV